MKEAQPNRPVYNYTQGPVLREKVQNLILGATNCQRFRQRAEFVIHGRLLDITEALSHESFIGGDKVTAQFSSRQTIEQVSALLLAQEPGSIIFANPIYRDPYRKSDHPQNIDELLGWLRGKHQAIFYGSKDTIASHPNVDRLYNFLEETCLRDTFENHHPFTPLIVHATVRRRYAQVWPVELFLQSYAPVRIKYPAVE